MPDLRIDRIETPTAGSKRRRLHLSDGRRLLLSAVAVEELGLVEGLPVDPSLDLELARRAEFEACRHRALRLLAVRPRTEQELRSRLIRADFEHSAISEVLERLREEGLVDDQAFAREYARSRSTGKGHAPRRIEQELRARGIEREWAHRAAWERYERDDRDPQAQLLDEAAALLRRRRPRYQGQAAGTARRRMGGLLARAGYPADVAIDAVDAELEQMRGEGLLAPDDDTEGR
jgi:regulatory protein